MLIRVDSTHEKSNRTLIIAYEKKDTICVATLDIDVGKKRCWDLGRVLGKKQKNCIVKFLTGKS